jgi:Flp pilus assembly protein TadD
MMTKRLRQWALAVAMLPALAACQTATGDPTSVTASTGGAIEHMARPRAGDEDLALGKEHFRNANYGLAEKHFRTAVEQAPDSLEPVIGLAAAYDQLGRFDLADRAYVEAMRMSGGSAAVLNNRGYSFYLRRDFKRARADFQQALRKDSQNAMARKNLQLVGG